MKYKDCGDCKHFVDKGNDRYTYVHLDNKDVMFQSDSTDTADECKYFKSKEG